MKIYLVTSNEWKIKSFNNILKSKKFNFHLEMLKWDYPEIKEDWTTSQVVLEWAKYCAKKYKKNVIVQDTWLFIEELNWFPWVNTKFALQTIWNKGILKLMQWVKNRNAKWIFSLWYSDTNWDTIEFTASLNWQISKDLRWNLWFWFDEIFIPNWYSETFWENPKLRDELSPFNETIEKMFNYLWKKLWTNKKL